MKTVLTLILACGAAFAQTPAFPTAVATDAQLKVAANNLRTTLRQGMSITDTTIVVADASKIQANMLLSIDNEIVNVSSVVNNNLVNVTRGFDGTTAAAHASGRIVESRVDRWHHEALKKEVQAIQNALGPGLVNVGGGVPAGQKTSDEVLLLPQTDSIWTRVMVNETAAKAGRNFGLVAVMDNCVATPVAGTPCTGTNGGAGDKVAAFFTAQPGPAKTTTLTAGINAVTNIIPLANLSAIIDSTLQSNYPVRIKIDNEEIAVCAIAGNNAVACNSGRGYFSTTAASHSSGATVKGISDVWGLNVQTIKRPDIGDDVNVNTVELNGHNNYADYAGTPGQRGSVSLLIASAGYYKPSHAVYINSSSSSNSFWMPVLVETYGDRGVFVGPPSPNGIDLVNTKANFGGKQLHNGDTVYFGQRLTDTSPSGYFMAFYSLGGSLLASLDVNGAFVTGGPMKTQGGAPYFDFKEGDAAADAKLWRWNVDGAEFALYTGNDAENSFTKVLGITRIGANPIRTNIRTLLNLTTTPAYANNAAALAGGLIAGDVYFSAGTDPGRLAVVF